MNAKDPKELAKKAADQIAEYAVHWNKIAQAPEWLRNYMAEEYPVQGVGRPALSDGQMMYVKPDVLTLQGIARSVRAMTLAEFLGAHENDPSKAAELAAAAHADLQTHWPEIAETKGPGKAPVIQQAFDEVFSQYGLSAKASAPNGLSKLAKKLQRKYSK